MATTENLFTGDGSTTNYSFTFEYIESSEVKADVAGVTTTDFTFANATTLSFNTAPANGAEVRIYRDTDIDTLKATFFAGSAIKAEDLNNNFTQNNFAVQEIKNNTWDSDLQTIKSNETWVSNDNQIATTAAMDARFQDEATETILSTETWVADDDHIATTQAIEDRIDEVITNDIGTDGTGITVTNDGDGTITLGLADNAIDFSKIKDEDIITYAEQNAGSPSWNSDGRLATTYAASQRFDTLVQTSTPVGSDWVSGKTWLQNDQDLTLSVWNGSNWLAIASGGAFINQPKVVYVDASSGSDNNDGHRISRPKKTIKAAVNQINADSSYGDGSVVVVAPGTYQEAAPIDITKKDVSIIGTALRSCVVHPTPATEENSLFRVNSGSFLQNLTFTGVKASGTRGGYSLDTDSTYGLPTNQGWNVSFYPGATIVKSPYIQNCTNFSDSEIDNSALSAHNPAGGSAGDTDSAVTGGGLLVDGAAVDSNSPLRSMVCDSYTHVGLDGPGILVTNNGYAQCTSSYAFFNHYHIKCLNGGQANLAASTTDFGRYGLVADGRSTSAIFTATTTASAADNDITFTIGAPSASSGWHGSATRPQSNMLVDIGGNTYPILSATANGSGWDVTISRPNPADRAENLGLNGAVSSGSAVSFYLRSMIASSGHTMEYVGSGTNYSALPENGGVPIENNQIIELNNGKVWTAITDHNGKFKVGDFFEVDQQNSSLTIASGSFQVNLNTLALNVSGNAVIGAPLDFNGNSIVDSTGTLTIEDTVDVNGNKIVNVTDPTLAQDAATKNYVDSTFVEVSGDTMTGALILPSGTAAAPALGVGSTDNGVYSPGADQVAISTNGAGRLFIDASGNVGVGTSSPGTILNIRSNTSDDGILLEKTDGTDIARLFFDGTSTDARLDMFSGGSANIQLRANGVSHFSGGNVGIGTTPNADSQLHVKSGANDGNPILRLEAATNNFLTFRQTGSVYDINVTASDPLSFSIGSSEKMRIDSSGRLLVGTSSSYGAINADDLTIGDRTQSEVGITLGATVASAIRFADAGNASAGMIQYVHNSAGTDYMNFYTNGSNERMRIDSSGNVGIGTSSPGALLDVYLGDNVAGTIARFGGYNNGRSLVISNSGIGNLIDINHQGGSGEISISTGSSERMRIDSSGRLLVGTSASTYNAARLQVVGSNSTSYISMLNTSASDNDGLGYNILAFRRRQSGGEESTSAYISSSHDGTGDDQKGRLVFSTNDGNDVNAPTERMRIDSSGRLLIGTTTEGFSPNADTLTLADSGDCGITIRSGSTSTGNLFFSDSTSGTAEYAGAIVYDHNDDSLELYSGGGTERMRIDSSGRLLVGTSSTSQSARAIFEGNNSSNAGVIRLACANSSPANGDVIGSLVYAGDDHDNVGDIYVSRDGGTWTQGSSQPTRMVFRTTADGASSPTERMRITSAGDVTTTGTSTFSRANAGFTARNGDSVSITRDSGTPLEINRETNDGALVNFYGQSTSEGTISVSGTTVSYNGAHLSRWSQLAGGVERTEILRGSVLSNIDEMCEWGEEENEQLNRMKVSDIEGDRNVSGVFQAWDDDDDTYINDFYCAMTGDFVIRIAQGVTVERGDLLMSAGDGTAKPQEDDIIRSKTIAKVTSTNVSETYADGSYCVPCVLMAC